MIKLQLTPAKANCTPHTPLKASNAVTCVEVSRNKQLLCFETSWSFFKRWLLQNLNIVKEFFEDFYRRIVYKFENMYAVKFLDFYFF
jgi:hypothetical protein